MFALILEMLALLVALVVVHELGHFAMAKLFNVRVHEFGVGFPPRLIGVRKGETLYSVNLIPLGGFVKLAGENDPKEPRSLAGKSVAVRALVLTAGPLMNILFALVIFAVLFMVPQRVTAGDVVVREVSPDSPAAMAGLGPGDVVLKANGRKIDNANDLALMINLKLGADMEWRVRRGDVTRTVHLTPRWRVPEGQGPTGVGLGMENPSVVNRSDPFWKAVPHAAVRLGEVLILIKNEITRWIIGAASPQVSGPIGIVHATKEVVDVGGISALVPLAALLSISLGIFNILPIPALDGGRLLFLVIEFVRRGKRIAPEKEGRVHMVGFALLITMIVLISYADILRIVRGESIFR